jgi:hypothetical protein
MMLNNEIEPYMQQWNYIKTRQAKTRKFDYLFSCSVVSMGVTNSHTLSWSGKKIIQNSTKYSNV